MIHLTNGVLVKSIISIFIDGSGVANSPQFYTSTLVHEAMHMINSTYQSYAVMSNNANNSVDTNLRWDHETWL